MEWELKYGEVAQSIINQCLNTGQPIPEYLQNQPEMEESLTLFMQAWADLSTDRQFYMDGSVGFIPWSSIMKYAEFYAISHEQADELFYFIKQLDTAYIKHIRSQLNNANKSKKKV